MNLHVLNGINPQAAAFLQGNTQRIQGNTQRIQGNTQRIQGLNASELMEYYVARAMGDQSAMQGTPIGFLKKLKARREQKKATKGVKKAAKQERRDMKRALRDRRNLARTERAERGEGFFQKAAGALSNFGEAQKIAAEAAAMAAAEGVDLQPDALLSTVDLVSRDAAITDQESQPSFFEQYKTPLLIGAGVVVVGTGIYLATRNNNPKKGRKR